MKSIRISFRFLQFFFLLILLCGCEKKEGKVFLRVINSINTNADITVEDKNQKIPIDGNYHEVSTYAEARYTLLKATWDSVTNWTPDCLRDQVSWREESLNVYFGEFEKLPGDSYYTINLDYKKKLSAVVKYDIIFFLGYSHITFTYQDNSSIRYSPLP